MDDSSSEEDSKKAKKAKKKEEKAKEQAPVNLIDDLLGMDTAPVTQNVPDNAFGGLDGIDFGGSSQPTQA